MMPVLKRLLRRSRRDAGSIPLPSRPAIPGIREYILGFCSQSPGARAYAETHLGRLMHTLEITPRGGPGERILEMGAYMQITPALQTQLGYGEVRGCYLGPLGTTDEKTVVSTSGESFHCSIDLFNAETDRFPYLDGSFQTVVCCELLEHLSEDPMHMMAEINRILCDGGRLVLSTPNMAALRAISAVLGGYHPGLYSQYSALKGGNATQPRHAREYTPGEIVQLLAASGFAAELLETGPYGLQRPVQHDWVIPILKKHRLNTGLREDTIHAVGRKTGPVKERHPAWLYDR